MPKIAQDDVNRDDITSEGKADLTDATREAGERAADAARESARIVRATAAETRETALHSAEAAADAGRMFVEILGEQARHNMQTAGALAQAVNWSEVADVQRDFIDDSVARMSRLGGMLITVTLVGVLAPLTTVFVVQGSRLRTRD